MTKLSERRLGPYIKAKLEEQGFDLSKDWKISAPSSWTAHFHVVDDWETRIPCTRILEGDVLVKIDGDYAVGHWNKLGHESGSLSFYDLEGQKTLAQFNLANGLDELFETLHICLTSIPIYHQRFDQTKWETIRETLYNGTIESGFVGVLGLGTIEVRHYEQWEDVQADMRYREALKIGERVWAWQKGEVLAQFREATPEEPWTPETSPRDWAPLPEKPKPSKRPGTLAEYIRYQFEMAGIENPEFVTHRGIYRETITGFGRPTEEAYGRRKISEISALKIVPNELVCYDSQIGIHRTVRWFTYPAEDGMYWNEGLVFGLGIFIDMKDILELKEVASDTYEYRPKMTTPGEWTVVPTERGMPMDPNEEYD